MNQNQITLSDVPNIPVGKLSTLAPAQLLSLQEQASEHLQKAKMLKEWLDNSISLKYRSFAANIGAETFKIQPAVEGGSNE